MYINIKETRVRTIHRDFYYMENDNKRGDRGYQTTKSARYTFVVAIFARGPLEAGSFASGTLSGRGGQPREVEEKV